MANHNQHRHETRTPVGLKTPVHTRYFHGQLLGVRQLEMEQEYYNYKRQLLNRLIIGPGVVCGLDVELTRDNKSVIVLPGFAIDRCGREIIVTRPTDPIKLPNHPPHSSDEGYENSKRARAYEHHEYCDEGYAHVMLCYHECESDPVRAVAGDCETVAYCVPGAVREQYEVSVQEGDAPIRKGNFPDVIDGRRISYAAIADFVTRSCRPRPEDCCLPLANIRLRHGHGGWEPEVDIAVRPIVYTNRLLYELIKSLVKKEETEYSEAD